MSYSMKHFYSEWDRYAAGWLRNLCEAGEIPAGTVDERSIEDVQASEVRGFVQAHFFAGIGGWPLALKLAGWPADLPVWTGSCPCQPFSAAGKARGVGDERHLWPAFHRLIAECRPPVIFGEQVASEDGRLWLAGVRVDLERLGYAVGAADLSAAGVGAPHIRQRLYWVGYADCGGRKPWAAPASAPRLRRPVGSNGGARGLAHADGGQPGDGGLQPGGEHGQQQEDRGFGGVALAQRERAGAGESGVEGQARGRRDRPAEHGEACGFWSPCSLLPCVDGKARRVEPGTFPLADGVPARLGKLRAYGNAIVPPLAAQFIQAFREA
jgi:DNA (cytosine-5)-methyltransferase 1